MPTALFAYHLPPSHFTFGRCQNASHCSFSLLIYSSRDLIGQRLAWATIIGCCSSYDLSFVTDWWFLVSVLYAIMAYFVPLPSVLMTTESRRMVLRPSRPRRPKWSMSSMKTFLWSDLGLSSLSTPDEYIFCISAADVAALWVVWSIPRAFKSFKSPMKTLFADMKAQSWAMLICRECGGDCRWRLIAALMLM